MRGFDFFIIPFLVDVTIAAAGIVTNLFSQDMQATALQLGLIGFSWGVIYALGSMISGRLSDRIPRRFLMTTGLLIYSIALTACSFARSVNQIIALSLLRGLGCSFFWAVFETYLHERDDHHETNRRTGLFNIGWTLGIIAGSASGGYLMAVGPRPVFRMMGALILMTLLYMNIRLIRYRTTSPHKAATTAKIKLNDKQLPSPKVRLKFLYISWVANFTLFLAAGASATIFPKVGRVEGMSDGAIGVILSLVHVGQGITFFVLSRRTSWHFRLSPIFIFQGMGFVGMIVLGLGSSIIVYSIGMLALGLGRGMSYASSLFYGLSASETRGANAGIHEMLVGSAFTFGPLLAGIVADMFFLKASFLFAGAVIMLSVIGQTKFAQSIRNV